jgi:hypothetical protein
MSRHVAVFDASMIDICLRDDPAGQQSALAIVVKYPMSDTSVAGSVVLENR